MPQPTIAIIGAGLSGLACARLLARAGVPFTLYESADAVGGRVRSARVDGFTLDRGFQVLLPAYPKPAVCSTMESSISARSTVALKSTLKIACIALPRATDPDALSGGWTATGEFFVTTTNTPPEVPTISAPQDGAVVPTLHPDLIILDAADVDHDVLVYDWELAADSTFGNVLESGTDQRQRVQPGERPDGGHEVLLARAVGRQGWRRARTRRRASRCRRITRRRRRRWR